MNLKIPKESKNVQLRFEKQNKISTYDIVIYLNIASPTHKGIQTIDELLNSSDIFLPIVIKQENDSFSLFNKNMINYILENKEEPQHSEKEFQIIFITGDSLMVNSCEVLPEFHSRPIDYLNNDKQFLTFQHKNKIIHINKNRIKRITQL